MRKLYDLIGRKFSMLSVVESVVVGTQNRWRCVCDCGNERLLTSPALVSGNTKSCGCLNDELRRSLGGKNFSHKKSKDRVYNIWALMKRRCCNVNNMNYSFYGGRGISIADEWHLFENFYKDMGDPPSTKHTLDRIDNDKNYCKENCRWSTVKEQSNNRRNTILFEVGDAKMNRTEFAKYLGTKISTISRYHSLGYNTKELILLFSRRKGKTGHLPKNILPSAVNN